MSTPFIRTLDANLSVNDILRHSPKAVALLSAYRIESCCRGHESLAVAGSALGLDPARTASEIVAGDSTPPGQPTACSLGCGHGK